jgi:glyoxylase-like metal-dependent hydrolase (beta-lactamase superfamily II)
MEVAGIAEGLWRWTAPHPEWKPEEDALDASYRDVGCVYVEGPGEVVLVDPLVPEGEGAGRFWRALDRDVVRVGGTVSVVLTTHWHLRSGAEIRDRYPGAEIVVGAPSAERLDLPDVRVVEPGARLPAGVEMLAAPPSSQVVLWIPAHRAVVPGDVVIGAHGGGLRLCPVEWLADASVEEQLRASLRGLLELPVERVLVSHGEPVLTGGRDALAAALA